jgi:hypothetical protein
MVDELKGEAAMIDVDPSIEAKFATGLAEPMDRE